MVTGTNAYYEPCTTGDPIASVLGTTARFIDCVLADQRGISFLKGRRVRKFQTLFTFNNSVLFMNVIRKYEMPFSGLV